MPIERIVGKSGTVYKFPEGVEPDYKSGWARYRDEGGDVVIDMRKDNIEAEIWQDGKVSTGKGLSN